MSRRWHNDLSPRIIATGLVISADHGNTGKLARAGLVPATAPRMPVMPQNFLQVMTMPSDPDWQTLRQRVTTQETRQTGGLMRPSRVVLVAHEPKEGNTAQVALTGKICAMPTARQPDQAVRACPSAISALGCLPSRRHRCYQPVAPTPRRLATSSKID